ncbi:MAG: DUF418 domain-containing protein [Halobacteriota archaeon]
MSSERLPTPPEERIVSLDVLRGVALLGILVINIWVFAMPQATLSNPTAYGDLTGWNFLVWLFSHVFAQQKLITIFTILFGAGIVLFIERKPDEWTALRYHYRRTGWLLVIGLAHAYLLWYGDILVSYALCGFVVVRARHWSPRTQFGAGLALVAVVSAAEIAAGISVGGEAIRSQWSPAQATISAEIEAYRGGWLAQMDHRVSAAFQRQTAGFLGYTAWRVGGLMLVGMALYRTGVLTNRRSAREYHRMIVGGGAVGLGLSLGGVWYITANGWSADAAIFYRQFNYWGSLFLAAAYVGIVMEYCRYRSDGLLARSFSAVGRTAFSNYLLQTVIATSIFYGHGLGLFGSLSRVELFGVVGVIWVVQLTLSVRWLRRFRYGPVEWLWRHLTYGSVQPIRR